MGASKNKMAKYLRCCCANIEIYTTTLSAVESKEIEQAVVKNLKIDALLKAVVGIGSIRKQVPQLIEEKVVKPNWTLFTCLNCCCDAFLIDSTRSSFVFANAELAKNVKPKVDSPAYSEVFHLILDDPENYANNILENPDDEDTKGTA